MATVIHHGGGVGTYKTFSVIQRHAIPQLKNGRTVISTIRGFNSTRVIEAVLDIELPESANIIYVDIETLDGLRKIRKWWEWAPVGAYVIIDEGQKVYPKGTKLSEYDYPPREGYDSEQTANLDDRPSGLIHAFTMQRHWNWDVAIMTPNINMLIPELKQVTQVAYAHRKMGDLIPWRKHGWRETKHLPEENWKSSATPPVQYNADKRIYKVYKSTKTGNHEDGGAEQSIFKHPKILFYFGLIFCSVAYFIYYFSTGSTDTPNTKNNVQNTTSSQQVSVSANTHNVRPKSSSKVPSAGHSIDPFIETTQLQSTDFISIVGQVGNDLIFEFGYPPESYQLTSFSLKQSGISVNKVNDCLAFIITETQRYRVRCPLHKRYFEPPEKEPVRDLSINPFSTASNSDA